MLIDRMRFCVVVVDNLMLEMSLREINKDIIRVNVRLSIIEDLSKLLD